MKKIMSHNIATKYVIAVLLFGICARVIHHGYPIIALITFTAISLILIITFEKSDPCTFCHEKGHCQKECPRLKKNINNKITKP